MINDLRSIVVEHKYSIAKGYPKAFFLWRLLQLHFHDLILLFHQSDLRQLFVIRGQHDYERENTQGTTRGKFRERHHEQNPHGYS